MWQSVLLTIDMNEIPEGANRQIDQNSASQAGILVYWNTEIWLAQKAVGHVFLTRISEQNHEYFFY